jgi:hypothetical protein
MRMPIVSLLNPEQPLWLTDDPPHGAHGHPVLIDSAGHVYRPTDTRGVMIVKSVVCRLDVYYAAKAAGYPLQWVD